MGEVIQFVSKSERERLRLIREARALYESVFPPSSPRGERRDGGPAAHEAAGAGIRRDDGSRA
jgi:hypothetical protein